MKDSKVTRMTSCNILGLRALDAGAALAGRLGLVNSGATAFLAAWPHRLGLQAPQDVQS